MVRSASVLALLAGVLALAACGSSSPGDGSASATPGANAAAGAEEAAFPATVEHRFGSTTVASAPKRVVVVGLREQDALLALGIDPVGTTEWLGDRPGAIFPWAEAALGGRPLPTKLGFTDGIEFEKVAALRPDLILAIYSGLSKKDYATLSKIAPTIAQPRGQVDWGSSWQDELTMTAKAVGKPKLGARLRAQAAARLAAAAKAHPEFQGQTAVVATPYEGLYVYGPQDARTRLLVSLGFTFPSALDDVGSDDFGGPLSEEKADLLDVGALLWFADPAPAAKLRAQPYYAPLKVHKQGRDIFIPERGTLYEATSFISVLSIPYLIDHLVPKLAAAADGDPATPTA
ncbi:MAG TPA: ABC transporter substrate-binding protein [Baekduia sp.]|uniref:ABC transporter substrate-binding protein n=1 Tax=Baekduia sp. TaxID=2600305 RepID=UPI002D77972B|nr:ABC transporter substrate-binding protein [Baekduia sp.]HET6508488.1 ABC transporter substrate-binding protein [Baekduia sp.]